MLLDSQGHTLNGQSTTCVEESSLFKLITNFQRILFRSFFRGIYDVPRESIAMPYHFRVWTPSWTGRLAGWHKWPRSHVKYILAAGNWYFTRTVKLLGIWFVSQCPDAQISPYFHVLWLWIIDGVHASRCILGNQGKAKQDGGHGWWRQPLNFAHRAECVDIINYS